MAPLIRNLAQRWRARREQAALDRRPIPDALWRRTLKRFAFLPQADTQEGEHLLRMTRLFLDRKEFSGAHGFQVSDDIAVAIAAQACLPVLALGLERYDGFVGIVVHPGQAIARRQTVDDSGLVHELDEVLSGEAVSGGPVMLSWRDVRSAGAKAAQGYNVVIHEFAHVLDMADGEANGTPPLPTDITPREWASVMTAEFQALQQSVDGGIDTALDPYAAQGPDEFFAVASESFFVDPLRLGTQHPALYALLQRYYRQDPAQRAPWRA